MVRLSLWQNQENYVKQQYESVIELKQFEFQHMQNNTLAEIKLRANEFIEDYERQAIERQYQKQKLKQNIMLEIMSNRHKSQTSQFGGQENSRIQSVRPENKLKGSALGTISEQGSLKGEKNNCFQYARSNSVPNAFKNNESDQNQELRRAQITFKMGKNNELYPPQYESKKEIDNKTQNNNSEVQNYYSNEQMKNSKGSQVYEKSIKNSKVNQRDNIQNFNRYQSFQNHKPPQAYIYPHQDEYDENIEHNVNKHQKNGVVFDLQEEQSVEISQQHKKKNCAFDIMMEKSDVIEDIDQLRRKKIEELEKKRQQRMQQFRRLEEAKEKDKRSNSFIKNKLKSHLNNHSKQDISPELSKSKSKKRIDSEKEVKGPLTSTISQQSSYNVKTTAQQSQRGSYYMPSVKNKNQNLNTQFFPTPKTITSQTRSNDKRKGKGSIFRQSPKRTDKSAIKYSQQPKIQPKQRKNTFNKQSNKKLMITALTNACLPGQLNRKERQKLVDVIQTQQAEFFVFLFKEYSRKIIKAIYVLDSSQTILQKIYGDKAPQQITSQIVKSFYRFDSGSRQFKKLDGCKSFSLVVHAIDIA